MNGYIYNDEDNYPMNDDPFNGYHNPTVYNSMAEMKTVESLPFTDPEPDKGCWNCIDYDPSAGVCMKDWNNLDPIYYQPDRDDHEPTDCCEYHEIDLAADPADFFELGGNEP